MNNLRFKYFIVLIVFFAHQGYAQTSNVNRNINELNFIEDIQLVQKGVNKKMEFVNPVNTNATNSLGNNVINTSKSQEENKLKNTIPTTSVINPYEKNIELCNARNFKFGQVLNIEVEKLTNDSLYQFIEKWLGTPYHFGGTSNAGIDCSGFTGMLHKTVFKSVLPRMAKDQYGASKKLERTEMKEGDLVFFNTRGGVSHVGVYLHNGYFVHASTKYGVIISSLNEGYYKQRFIGAGRVGG
ncbi:MAG: C40 family peptidase [Sphingobacteriales bacterium]|nr:C40 family peptidase [Sphingobacteriales bacterium]